MRQKMADKNAVVLDDYTLQLIETLKVKKEASVLDDDNSLSSEEELEIYRAEREKRRRRILKERKQKAIDKEEERVKNTIQAKMNNTRARLVGTGTGGLLGGIGLQKNENETQTKTMFDHTGEVGFEDKTFALTSTTTAPIPPTAPPPLTTEQIAAKKARSEKRAKERASTRRATKLAMKYTRNVQSMSIYMSMVYESKQQAMLSEQMAEEELKKKYEGIIQKKHEAHLAKIEKAELIAGERERWGCGNVNELNN